MKRAILKKVVLENFMCYAHAEFVFYAITKIMAKNGNCLLYTSDAADE